MEFSEIDSHLRRGYVLAQRNAHLNAETLTQMVKTAAVLFTLALAIPAQAQIHLKAETATTKEIALSWTGSASAECHLQRKAAAPINWAEVATTKDAHAKDEKVGAYATYTYHATCGAQISNEVTVGPPPAGFHLIAPKPENRPDSSFGRLVSLALDGNGDPVAAFVYGDPNGDGHFEDTQIMFVSWDRAAYRWKEPVTVAVVGNYDPRPPVVGVSLAHDSDTGAYGVTWIDPDNKSLNLALSRDSGVTWKSQKAFTDARALGGASLALAGGKAHIIVSQDSKNTIRYMTGSIDDDPGKWEVKFAPLFDGAIGVHRGSSLALDSKGAVAVAYWMRPPNGNNWTLGIWRPATDSWVNALITQGAKYPPEGVILEFVGTQPAVIIDSRINSAEISSHYSIFSKDNGDTWSVPVAIPDDGNEHIGGFMSFARAADGRAAFAGDVAGGNTSGMKCTWPKLARTSDYASWKTCSPQGGLQPDTRTNWGAVIFSPSGMLYMVFLNRQISPTQPLKAGLMIWGGK